MSKRGAVQNRNPPSNGKTPFYHQKLTFGQRAADFVTKSLGSWRFLGLFALYLLFWMGINTWFLLKKPFDPYPFILLNLTLSCLAAVQAPMILMAQNRQEERDRIQAKYDYQVNRKAEREIQQLQKQLNRIETRMGKK